MTITAVFESLEEMQGFAKKLIGEQSAVVVTAPVQVEPAVTSTLQGNKVIKEETTVAEETPTYKLEDVRAKLAELTKAGKRAEVQALIKSYGKEKLTEIDSSDYVDLMQKAGEL